MNIFWLSNDAHEAAIAQCDKHVVKMILESAQMLSAVHRLFGNDDERLYKLTHKNHPCTKWAMESASNYKWLYSHFMSLSLEYTKRYGKIHKTWTKLAQLLAKPPTDLVDIGQTAPAQAMPDEFRCDDPVKAYRAYYQSKRETITMKWKLDNQPDWWQQR